MKKSATVISTMLLACALSQSMAAQAGSWTPFGIGCPGNVGVPLIAPAGGSLPSVGATFMLEVTNLPGSGLGVGITGASDQMWGAFALPLDLTNLLAMPGCTLFTDVRRTRTLTIAGGRADWPLMIPNDPGLQGVVFCQQAFILDPGVPGLGAVMSSAGRGVIGAAGAVMRVTMFGGRMGNAGVPGLRLLRNDPTTGALIEDVITDANGVATFGGITTARTTISVVSPSPTPLFDDNEIFSMVGIPVEDTAISGFEPSPAAVATFNVSLNPVPSGQTSGWISPGGYGDVSAVRVFGTFAPNVRVEQVQPDGLFSMMTLADGMFGPLSSCGWLLDQDPATVTSPVSINTNQPVVTISYTANSSVIPAGWNMRRKSMFYELFFTNLSQAASGSFASCAVPGADRYAYEFESPGLIVAELFASPPANINVTMPNLNVSNPDFDFSSQTASWALSGSDLVNMDLNFVRLTWTGGGSAQFLRSIWLAPAEISVIVPAVPLDLAAYVPPSSGVSIEVCTGGFDSVVGFDEFVAAVTDNGGDIGGPLFLSTRVEFACEEGGPTDEGNNEDDPRPARRRGLLGRLLGR